MNLKKNSKIPLDKFMNSTFPYFTKIQKIILFSILAIILITIFNYLAELIPPFLFANKYFILDNLSQHQKDIIQEGQRVLICDDLLATGGTAKAAAKLIEKINGTIVGFAFIIELLELNGRNMIKDYRSESLVEY